MPASVAQAAKAGIKSAEYEAYAASQINYMLGDNPNNFSYVIGYGDSFPKQPHHKVSTSVEKFFGISPSGRCLCLPSCRVHLGNLQQHGDGQPSPVERGLGGNFQNANGKFWCSLILLMFLNIGVALKYYWRF